MKNYFPKIPLLLSITFFAILVAAFMFSFQQINNENLEAQLKEGEWHNETERREEIKSLNRSIKIIETEREKLETHFARSSDIVPFLDTIEGLAPKVGVKAEVSSVNILEDHSGLLVVMAAAGTFEGVYKFLILLENSPYELEFTGIDMQRQVGVFTGPKGKQVPIWGATFKIKLLSFVE